MSFNIVERLECNGRNCCLDAKAEIEMLRDLLRDVYDVAASGERISEGLLSRIRCEMSRGRNR